METPRTSLRGSAIAVGFALLLGTSSAHAQLQLPSAFSNPLGYSYHTLDFISVSNIQDITTTRLVLFGGYQTYRYGFSFVGTTSSGASYTVQILGPGGNTIAARIDPTQRDLMEIVVRRFATNPRGAFSVLRISSLEKTIFSPVYSVSHRSEMTIQVASPIVSSYGGLSGGLVELSVPATGDFFIESVLRRRGSCGGGYKDSRVSVLRSRREFILDGVDFFQYLDPAPLAVVEWFLEEALDAVAGTVVDISGAEKLEDDPPHVDPYHIARGRCSSTWVIYDFSWIVIRTLRN